MTDEQFQRLAQLYGFAPSRALRELVEAVETAERGACCRIVYGLCSSDNNALEIAKAIQAREQRCHR